jgi:hypothetical protein
VLILVITYLKSRKVLGLNAWALSDNRFRNSTKGEKSRFQYVATSLVVNLRTGKNRTNLVKLSITNNVNSLPRLVFVSGPINSMKTLPRGKYDEVAVWNPTWAFCAGLARLDKSHCRTYRETAQPGPIEMGKLAPRLKRPQIP